MTSCWPLCGRRACTSLSKALQIGVTQTQTLWTTKSLSHSICYQKCHHLSIAKSSNLLVPLSTSSVSAATTSACFAISPALSEASAPGNTLIIWVLCEHFKTLKIGKMTYAGDELSAIYQGKSFLCLKTDWGQVVALQDIPAYMGHER